MSKVSFIKSEDRKYNIERSLSLLKGEVMAGLRDAKNIVVKPNCTSDREKSSVTHLDALESVLRFIRPFTKVQVTVAEGTGDGETLNAFKNFNYLALQELYDFTIVDLNQDDWEFVTLLDKSGRKFKAKVAKTLLRSDYLISLTLPKTHNEVIFSGGIKNIAMSGLIKESGAGFGLSKLKIKKNYKQMIHQGNYYTNLNIKILSSLITPHLSVIDGYEIMEGDGPIKGNILPGHFSVASSDPLAADWLACTMMGINFEDVGYLKMLDDEDELRTDYFVVGDPWQKYQYRVKMPSSIENIKNWQKN